MINTHPALSILKRVKSQQLTISGNEKSTTTLKDSLGYIPTSIFDVDWSETKILKDFVGDVGDTRKGGGKAVNSMVGISIFNPYLCMCLLRAYAPPHADIYDPFGGGGTRAIISTIMGHKYTGCEIRQEEIDVVQKRAKVLGLDFTLHHKDARDFKAHREFNFSLTCPPYYDLEQYQGGSNDLSMLGTYKEFMGGIQSTMNNVYESLKPGSFSIWVIGNFRDKKSNLIDFHGNVITVANRAGFDFHDDIVFHSAPGSAVQRAGVFTANKRATKIHEYIVIFKK